MFKPELDYFIAHQEELVRQHGGKVLVLRGAEVVAVCETPLAAYLTAQQRYQPGTFMIQPCEPGPGAYTVTINTGEPPTA